MKFSENWLRTFVNPSVSITELAEALTMAGLEVEAIEPVAPAFEKVVVAEVLSVQKASGRRSSCYMSGKYRGRYRASADRVRRSQFARWNQGAMCPARCPAAAEYHQTKQHTGVESAGMLCSASELGLSGEVEGLCVLPPDAPTGADFRDYYELDDKLVTLKLTPNRGDCLGLRGVAREVSAITGEAARPAPVHPIVNQSDDALAVRVEAADACPLYCGRVIRGIRSDVPTPQWIARRLERSGMRTINTVVDVTNYVMLEFGQPLHAFDLARISGGLMGAIYVRYAKPGEPSSSMAKTLASRPTEPVDEKITYC